MYVSISPPPCPALCLILFLWQSVDGGVSLLPSVRVEPGSASSRRHR